MSFNVLGTVIEVLSLVRVQTCLVARTVKNLPAMRETRVQSLGWEDSLEEVMATHSNGQRSLVGYGPQGQKELDVTKPLSR